MRRFRSTPCASCECRSSTCTTDRGRSPSHGTRSIEQHRIAVSILVAVALITVSCGPTQRPATTRREFQVSVAGTERSFWMFDPPGARALVIALHPLSWTAADFASYIGFDSYAAADGFRVVYPQGLSKAWNAGYCCPAFHPVAADDTAFVRQLMASEANTGWKVFLLGFSNGAMLAFHMACVDPHEITALGTLGSDGEQCSVGPPLPSILHFQGTADTFTGNRLWADTAGGWVNTGLRATDWWQEQGAKVQLVSVARKGHDWYKKDPDASAQIAEFFRRRA